MDDLEQKTSGNPLRSLQLKTFPLHRNIEIDFPRLPDDNTIRINEQRAPDFTVFAAGAHNATA